MTSACPQWILVHCRMLKSCCSSVACSLLFVWIQFSLLHPTPSRWCLCKRGMFIVIALDKDQTMDISEEWTERSDWCIGYDIVISRWVACQCTDEISALISTISIELSRLERMAPRESESVHEILSFKHICEKMSIFDPLRPTESNGARVGFVELVELYLAPSTRVAGSIYGRIVLRNTRIWVPT